MRESVLLHETFGPFIREHFTESYETMGDPRSSEPGKFREMLGEWEALKKETRLQIPAPEAGTGL